MKKQKPWFVELPIVISGAFQIALIVNVIILFFDSSSQHNFSPEIIPLLAVLSLSTYACFSFVFED